VFEVCFKVQNVAFSHSIIQAENVLCYTLIALCSKRLLFTSALCSYMVRFQASFGFSYVRLLQLRHGME